MLFKVLHYGRVKNGLVLNKYPLTASYSTLVSKLGQPQKQQYKGTAVKEIGWYIEWEDREKQIITGRFIGAQVRDFPNCIYKWDVYYTKNCDEGRLISLLYSDKTAAELVEIQNDKNFYHIYFAGRRQ